MRLTWNFPVTIIFFIVLLSVIGSGSIKAQTTNEAFKPSGKVVGYAFLDFFVKSGGDTATWASKVDYSGVPHNATAFSLRRMYLGYDYTISPVFSTQVLLEGSDGALDTRGDRSVFIKALNVRWKGIYKGADLVIGQQPTLAYALLIEKFWGYRSIEKTMLDQRGVRASSDMGIALNGKFDSLGTFGYNMMISNGSGPKPEELTGPGKNKLYAANIFGYFLDRKIVVDLYGEILPGLPHKEFTAMRAFVGYENKTKSFAIGTEVYSQTQNNVKSDSTNATPFGFSVFARGRIIKDKLSAFARYDSYNQDNSFRDQDAIKTYNASKMYLNYDEQFITAGLDYSPHKNVHIMPNIWYNSYKAKAESALLVDRKADVVPRVTFYFIYK